MYRMQSTKKSDYLTAVNGAWSTANHKNILFCQNIYKYRNTSLSF